MVTAPTHKPEGRSGVTERVPPQDIDAEAALLGSMMMSRDAIGDVIPIIGRPDSEWFYVPAHQQLFEVLIDLYDDPTKAIDLIIVTDELRRRDMLELVGGQEYMVRLAESFGDWANAEHYARIVRDKGMLRSLIRCASEITDQAYAGMEEAREILDKSEQRIFEVTERRVSGQTVAIRDAVAKLAQQLEEGSDSICTGLPSGFNKLDELTTGFHGGELIIVAARPSMGKTAWGLNVAEHLAMVEKKSVAFFSMEMGCDQIAQRLMCSHAGIDAQRLRRRMLNDDEMFRVVNAREDFREAKFYVDDTPGTTAMELRASARRMRNKYGIEIVFVDYLQLMHNPGSNNRQEEISTISRSLKSLGRELGIPIVAMAQLNRMSEGRQDKRPIMSDLRESGAIEQDADVILLIHREEYYSPEDESVHGLAELILAKQRNGPTGSIQLQFNKKLTRFSNYSMQEVPFSAGQIDHGNAPF